MWFGGQPYGRPAQIAWVTSASTLDGRTAIWVSGHHALQYPSIVYRLNPPRGVLGRYFSNGRLHRVRFAEFGGCQYALLASVSKERRTAALAVLDASFAGASAPAGTAGYRCDDCPARAPDHYLLFPRTNLGAFDAGMPLVLDGPDVQAQEIGVSVSRLLFHPPSEPRPSLASTNDRLNSAFHVRGADIAGDYVVLCDYFHAHGRLDHAVDRDRERSRLWPVLRWNGSA